MKVPKSVLIIGTADLIQYTIKGRNRATDRWLTNYLLAVNKSHTVLYLFPNKTTGAVKRIKDAHGIQSGHLHTAVQYEIPSIDLKSIGTISCIQYSTDWWENESLKYEHVFETPAIMYADKLSRFKVIGFKLKRGKIINETGIIG